MGAKVVKGSNSMGKWMCPHQNLFFSSNSICFLGFCLIIATFGFLFSWLVLPPFDKPGAELVGCREDGEGSWSIGVFHGKTPFSLQPIETENIGKDASSAWPVANPVFTCASVVDKRYPSNFVADPFLFIQRVSP